jgi:hypothetical protein
MNGWEKLMLGVHIDKIGKMAIVECEGRIVRSESALRLREAVISQLDARIIVIDLSEVTAVEQREFEWHDQRSIAAEIPACPDRHLHKKQVDKVLATATGRVTLLCELMRWTAMALVDAQKFGMSLEDAQHLGLSKPERRPVLESETLIRGRRTKTNERYRVRISRSLAEQLQGLGSPAFPGAESLWRERVKKLFRDAGERMTPHGFRHYRISEWLAQGFQPNDVSKWLAHRKRKSARHTNTGCRKQKIVSTPSASIVDCAGS